MTPRSGLRLGLALAVAVLAAGVGGACRDGGPVATSASRRSSTAARRGGVPPEVLHAVALTETGPQAGRAAARLALGDQPRGQGPLVRDPRGGAGLREGEPRRGAAELRRRLRADQLPLARPRLPLGRGDVRPRMDRDLRGAVPAHALRGARQLVGGGRRLPFADARARADLPRALRPAAGGSRPRRADRGRGAGRRRRCRPTAAQHAARRGARRSGAPWPSASAPAGPPPAADDGGSPAALFVPAAGALLVAGHAAADRGAAADRRAARRPVLRPRRWR